MTAEFVLMIAALALDKGVPATIRIIQALKVDSVTLEDIRALRTKIKRPEEYFKNV